MLPFLALVTISQGLCKGDDGSSTGVCMKTRACTAMAGSKSIGSCASGFGTCCQS